MYRSSIREDEEVGLTDTETDSSDIAYDSLSEGSDYNDFGLQVYAVLLAKKSSKTGQLLMLRSHLWLVPLYQDQIRTVVLGFPAHPAPDLWQYRP